MKKLFLAGLILSMTMYSAFAETTDTAIDKNNLAEKIKIANKNTLRSRIECAAKTGLKNIMSTETTTTSDLDPKNKIMHIVTEVKTFDFSLQDIFKTQAEKSIAAAKEKGATAEKIEKMQKLAAGLSSGMEKMLSGFKGKKYEMYHFDNKLYIYLKDRWIKFEPSGEDPGGQGLAQQSNFPALLASGKTPGSLCGAIGLERLLQNINSVSEGDCAGNPCYILGIDTKGMGFLLQQKLLASQSQGKDRNLQVAVDSLTIKLSVAQDNYLLLSSTANAEMVLYDPVRPGYSMRQSVNENTAYTYPTSLIELPPELSQAVVVKDKEELKKMLTEGMRIEDFLEGMKGANKKNEPETKAGPETK